MPSRISYDESGLRHGIADERLPIWAGPPKLSCMSRLIASICALVLFVILAGGMDASPQDATATPKGVVVLTKLSVPVYPAIARTAHILGDVELMLEIRQDGSIESAAVVSGPPLLRSAAMTSAQQSQFECHGCSAEPTSYRLVYAFRLVESGCCAEDETKTTDIGPPRTYPQISRSQNRV